MTAISASSALLNSPLMRRSTRAVDLEYQTNAGTGGTITKAASFLGKFAKRYKRNENPDASTKLRRMLGGKSFSLPPEICKMFTEGQRAVLHVIANVVKQNGCCDWPRDKIAFQAGVSRRTMQYTIKKASSLGFLSIQYRRLAPNRNDTNIIRLVCSVWKSWLKKIRKDWKVVQGCKELHPMKDKNLNNSNSRVNEPISVQAERSRNGLRTRKRPDD